MKNTKTPALIVSTKLNQVQSGAPQGFHNDKIGNFVPIHYDENSSVSMYTEPPQNIISLHEFQKIALDRLQVLKKLEFMHDANEDSTTIAKTILGMTLTNRIALHIKTKPRVGTSSGVVT